MSKNSVEQFIVDSKGQRTAVILDMERYQRLAQLKAIINVSEIIKEAKTILNKEPIDTHALAELIEDLEDIQYIFEHKDEKVIPWEEVKSKLGHQGKP